MLKYAIKQWDKNKDKFETAISMLPNAYIDYDTLLKLLIKTVWNDNDNDKPCNLDYDNIIKIDNGSYSGTFLFIIPQLTYDPTEEEYFMTFVHYGSCTCCDTIKNIQDGGKKTETPTKEQLNDYVTLGRHLICNMIKPYRKKQLGF